MAYSQTDRPIQVSSPLGPDVLLVERLFCNEAVSEQFEIVLDLLSLDAAIDPKQLLRKPMTVTIALAGGAGERHWNGLVRRFVQRGRDREFTSYRAELVPATWFLSLASDCKIFQNKSVPDIVKAVLGDMGVSDFKATLGSHPPREYCVQYRETHLAFISRLLEEEGIFYFFEHTKDKHFFVMADAPSAVKAGPASKLKMNKAAGMAGEDTVTSLSVDNEVVTGRVTIADYNDTVTKRYESTIAGTTEGTSAKKLQRYDYPGKFAAVPEGDRLARLRLEEAEALGASVIGTTNYRGLGSGQKVEIKDHYRDDVNAAYHVLSAKHAAVQGGFRAGDMQPFEFETAFTAIPHMTPYRPPRVTPKSIVHGTQTAIVVGVAGEEIYVDKFGRVKVQFYWDREGKKDEKSSCWVRVSSTWAGKAWGAVSLPRIGQEVVVDFLEGDPDRPIIVGRVYNSEQMPPYELPANMTQSGVKSRSTMKGGTADSNEFRFEDKKGSEEIYLHAQKDHNIVVLNNETTKITANRTETVGKDEDVKVDGKRTVTVKGDDGLTITTGNHSFTVQTGNQTTKIDKGNRETTVGMGNETLKVSMGNLETKVSMGNVALKAALGQIAYEAMMGIELKVGQSSIKIDQTGVTIKGMMVKIEGQIMTEVKGMMTQIKGDAMLMVKGGITMIN